MRLIFLFTSDGAAQEGSMRPWNPNAETYNFYAKDDNGLRSEGYLYMLHEMVNQGIIDDLLIFIESTRSPGSTIYYKHIWCYVVPEIGYVRQFLKEGDIIWARGGFRSWFNFLNQMKEEKRWLLLYAANTGRARWRFWDVVFDDLHGKHCYDSRGRFFYYFKKPINPDYFRPLHDLGKRYDICVGASHVHDKKGQWKTIEVIAEYKRLFSENLRCIMPGRITHGVRTNKVNTIIDSARLMVDCPGMLSRSKVAEVLNQSHLSVFMGQSGQNDRGPLESLQCGTPVMLASTVRHCPSIWKDNPFCTIAKNPNDITALAHQLKAVLDKHRKAARVRIRCNGFFESKNGLYSVIVPEMKRLFKVFRKYPVPDIQPLIREYIESDRP
jgi:glycosyltransferase involved in cell wall biosynthesis